MKKSIVDTVITELSSASNLKPNTIIHIPEAHILHLLYKSRELLLSQPPLLELESPLLVCGDIHGQFYDLLRIFKFGGNPSENNYLFLGDYVDRGRQNIETICYLLALKIKYPENFFLLRGNHETSKINRIYGFYEECKKRYNIKLWKEFCGVFDCMPIAAIIEERIFCVHGGLSPDLKDVGQIENIKRPLDIPEKGFLCDLLWSDPEKEKEGWLANSRGISVTFGKKELKGFLGEQDFDLVCRAHQVVEDGYEFFGDRQLVTVFSAPNYCGQFDNCGAFMKINENLVCSFFVLKPEFN